jgi:hypothetical protein
VRMVSTTVTRLQAGAGLDSFEVRNQEWVEKKKERREMLLAEKELEPKKLAARTAPKNRILGE